MWDWSSYFLFLSTMLVGYYFLSVYDKKPINKGGLFLILGLLPTFLILALRGREVGIDLVRYEVRVHNSAYMTYDMFIESLREPGAIIIQWVSYKLGGLHAFIIITSIIEYLFFFIALRNFKKRGIDIKIIYLFFFSYIVIRSFNIVRNGIAWTISLCAYSHLIGSYKGDKRNYWIYTLLALSIHNSAIMNILIYFVCWPIKEYRAGNSANMLWKRLALISILSFLFFFSGRDYFIEKFADMSSEVYGEDYFGVKSGFGVGNILVRLPFLFLAVYSFDVLKNRFRYTFFPVFMLVIFDIIISNLKYYTTAFERLACFTGLGEVILWGMLAQAYKYKMSKSVTSFFFIYSLIYFSYYMYRWGVTGGTGIGIGIMPYNFWNQ